jgi:quercetin dioxygenase-like cupin family protein
MNVTVLQMQPSFIQIKDSIEYPQEGISKKVLLKDSCAQYTLLCLAAGTKISEHTAPRNATVHVLAGQGKLMLEGEVIPLEAGTFVVMPARARHALEAEENLAFLLIFSEPFAEKS